MSTASTDGTPTPPPSSSFDSTTSATASTTSKTNGQPKPVGIVHPTLQQVECPVDNLPSLRAYLGSEEDPFCNWQQDDDRNHVNVQDLTTWFPRDDQVAFYTPSSEPQAHANQEEQQYDTLTYKQLQEQLTKCPSFLSAGDSSTTFAADSTTKVAICLPINQMSEMAMTILSVLASGAVAVPLDPRMPTRRILLAMQQLECTCLISTKEWLLEKKIVVPVQQQNEDETDASPTNDDDDAKTVFQTHPSLLQLDQRGNNEADQSLAQDLSFILHEIRVVATDVAGGGCGRLSWTCLSRFTTADSTTTATATNDTNGGLSDHSLQQPWCVMAQTKQTNKNRLVVAGPRDGKELAMLLRTSGTTNQPKVVPISRHMLLYGATSIAAALQLQRKDCNANSMPFYHVGGIACNLLAVLVSGGSVLMAGPLTDPNIFLDHLSITSQDSNDNVHQRPIPTWYYAGPSMHKAIVLMGEARLSQQNRNHHHHSKKKDKRKLSPGSLSTHLRFIRSASAHLNHDLALRLSTVFGCQVIPTYGMSEAMPICSSAPIDVRQDPPCDVVDSVGYATGTSVRIVDPDTDQVLPHVAYGKEDDDASSMDRTKADTAVGEICVKGAGVISHYVGLDVTKTHSVDGWLRTGDHGILDRHGRLFIKGRSKEMIKRGGEQVWPNEIDDVVEKVPGVATAVAFGVPNELWGEEVAVAVVLADASQIDHPGYLKQLTDDILSTCRSHLDELSMPQQFKCVASAKELLRGSTGKYIRSGMAQHLGVTAVDTGALKVLTSASQFQKQNDPQSAIGEIALSNKQADDQAGKWDWLQEILDSKIDEGRRIIPSEALNGVRFFVACCVVYVHVGIFPNLTFEKWKGYTPNMMIFFSLAGFQTTCQVARSVKGQWANFVGTKIGVVHTLFVVSQLITFPSYVLFNAFDDEGTQLIWNAADWTAVIARFLFSTATGLGHSQDVNMFAWFQSTYYCFLVFFPFLDHYLRRQCLKRQLVMLVGFGILSAGVSFCGVYCLLFRLL